MIHWRARRLLPSLPDGGLSPQRELAVRRHLARCPRCARALRELELDEALLRRLPLAMVPLAASPEAYGRLAALARWSGEPDLPDPDRRRGAALGLAATLATIVVVTTLAAWSPVMRGNGSRLTPASILPDAAFLPVGFQQGRF